MTEPHVGTHLFRALGDGLGEGMHVAGGAVVDDEHPRHAIKRVAHGHDPWFLWNVSSVLAIEPRGASSASCWAMTSCRPLRSREPGRRPGTTPRRPGRCWSAPGSPPIAARVPGRADPTRSLGTPTWRTRPRGARRRALPARTNR